MQIVSEIELARQLQIHVRTIQRARRRGNPPFPFVQVNGKILYDLDFVINHFKHWPKQASNLEDCALVRQKKPPHSGSALAIVGNEIPRRRGRPRKQV